MENGDAPLGAQRAERILELASLVHRLLDEGLDDRFAERRQFAAAISAEETFHAGETDSVDLHRLLVEHGHSGLVENVRDLLRLAAFVIMIAENSEDRD